MKRRVYLPDEIITSSSGLDLKSKIKCMVVCKQWRNLVSDHYKRQFLVYDSIQRRFGALDEETNQIDWMYGEPHLKFVLRFMSSCNGLVCYLADHYDVYICNPLTGEYVSIPSPQGQVYQCSLGFCSSRNEYKLTCLTPYALETYTLGSSAGWRSVPFDYEKVLGLDRAAICVNGVFHWLRDTQGILTFDLAEEALGSIPSPRLDDGKNIYQLECMDNCLVVTAGNYQLGLLEIWVRKEDKLSGESVWTKNWVITGAQPFIRINLSWLVPQKVSIDRAIIMRDQVYDGLYSYDSRDKLVRRVWECRYAICLYSYYMPTLISPKKLMQKRTGIEKRKKKSRSSAGDSLTLYE